MEGRLTAREIVADARADLVRKERVAAPPRVPRPSSSHGRSRPPSSGAANTAPRPKGAARLPPLGALPRSTSAGRLDDTHHADPDASVDRRPQSGESTKENNDAKGSLHSKHHSKQHKAHHSKSTTHLADDAPDYKAHDKHEADGSGVVSTRRHAPGAPSKKKTPATGEEEDEAAERGGGDSGSGGVTGGAVVPKLDFDALEEEEEEEEDARNNTDAPLAQAEQAATQDAAEDGGSSRAEYTRPGSARPGSGQSARPGSARARFRPPSARGARPGSARARFRSPPPGQQPHHAGGDTGDAVVVSNAADTQMVLPAGVGGGAGGEHDHQEGGGRVPRLDLDATIPGGGQRVDGSAQPLGTARDHGDVLKESAYADSNAALKELALLRSQRMGTPLPE